ncbi:hypothetical protein M5K25_018281 [Dendrobium thyrsiflorum]|uniref:Uncharacterized protein n=1 Tax=Dendrobium thyrsiflorum TaxID=117978 RepID=A0ABD0UHN3_DENTH
MGQVRSRVASLASHRSLCRPRVVVRPPPFTCRSPAALYLCFCNLCPISNTWPSFHNHTSCDQPEHSKRPPIVLDPQFNLQERFKAFQSNLPRDALPGPEVTRGTTWTNKVSQPGGQKNPTASRSEEKLTQVVYGPCFPRNYKEAGKLNKQ